MTVRTFPEAWSGSSPLARGLLGAPLVLRQGVGIIPARAGFTVRHRGARQGRWDHPRSRGVYSQPDDKGTNAWGSSPLARGLRVSTKDILAGGRIIPARAGFTRLRGAITEQVRDHPRSRGVYLAGGGSIAERAGSSPLARGLQARGFGRVAGVGIIPARAGFTWPTRRRRSRRPDHPRSRGVYALRTMSRSKTFGSSPLARGLRDRASSTYSSRRIIPARAGFTQRYCQSP